jgi:hypothetical protein
MAIFQLHRFVKSSAKLGKGEREIDYMDYYSVPETYCRECGGQPTALLRTDCGISSFRSPQTMSSSHLALFHEPLLLFPALHQTLQDGGMASSWPAPSIASTHLTRPGANNSAPGLVPWMMLTSSRIPALMTMVPSIPPKVSPYRYRVVPTVVHVRSHTSTNQC